VVFIAVLFMWDFLLYIDVVFDILDKQMRSRIVLKNFVVGKSCNICVLQCVNWEVDIGGLTSYE
jgi:hypothetical protein